MHSGSAESARAIATERRIPVDSSAGSRSRMCAHAHHLQQAVDDLENLVLVESAALTQRKGNILADSQRIEQRAALEDHRDFLADALHVAVSP